MNKLFFFSAATLVACSSRGTIGESIADLDNVTGSLTAVEASAVVALVNDRSVDVERYVFDVHISRATAEAIVHVRNGTNGIDESRPDQLGGDDEAFVSVTELDALPGTDLTAFDRLRSYARAHGYLRPEAPPLRMLAVGEYHACEVTRDGELSCWGGGTPAHPFAATVVPPGKYLFTPPAPTGRHTCAIRLDRTLACWGALTYYASEPTVAPPPGNFRKVVASEDDNCAIRDDDSVVCWGTEPAVQAAPAGRYRDVAMAGPMKACALDMEGKAVCWGPPAFRPLGDVAPEQRFASLAVSGRSECGIRVDGSLSCWVVSDPLLAPPDGYFLSVGVAKNHSCGLREDHTIECWGYEREIVRGAPAGRYQAVAVGKPGVCAIPEDGTTTRCWGNYTFPGSPQH